MPGSTRAQNLIRAIGAPESQIPESFNVLVKELEGLGLNIVLE